MPKLALYCDDQSVTDRRNLLHNAACKRDWRHPFTIASHILQSSYNELSEKCQCLSLFMQYLSRNLVSQLSGPQYEFRQLGKIRWRDPVRIELPSITGPRLGARAFDVRNLRHEQPHMPLAIAWPASNE
jgi:hypothetical protein